MRIITSCLKALCAQLLLAGTAGPLLCYWLESSPFATERLSGFFIPDASGSAYRQITLTVCALLCLCGMVYGRLTRARDGARRLRAPFLLWPALLMLAWTYALHDSGGNYNAETTAWTVTRLLSQPPYELLWLAEMATMTDLGSFLSQGAPPSLLYWLFPGTGSDFFVHYGFFYQALFESWRGIGAGLFFQLSLLTGIAIAGKRPEKRAFHAARTRFRQKALAGFALLLPLLGPAAVLTWQIQAIEKTLVSPRSDRDDPNIVGGEVSLALYTPFRDDSFLARLDGPASMRISRDHPRLDGATAFYPVYAAFFKAVYCQPSSQPPAAAAPLASPDILRNDNKQTDAWRGTLHCSTTRKAYSRLIRKETDIVFAFEPSAAQLQEAQKNGVKLRLIPIGKEAFVFMVHEANPVNSLSLAQIQDIYTRAKTNWNNFGGPDKRIMPYQRPENSGSQTIMLSSVMRGKKITEPLREELVLEMGGIITQVAEYRNEDTSIGYSFRWYATQMRRLASSKARMPRAKDAWKNTGLKLLAVNGIYPTPGSIADGSYPFTALFYAVVRDEALPEQTQVLLDWITGPQGQTLIARTGYVPLHAGKAGATPYSPE